MAGLGMPDSKSLLVALQQVAKEVAQEIYSGSIVDFIKRKTWKERGVDHVNPIPCPIYGGQMKYFGKLHGIKGYFCACMDDDRIIWAGETGD